MCVKLWNVIVEKNKDDLLKANDSTRISLWRINEKRNIIIAIRKSKVNLPFEIQLLIIKGEVNIINKWNTEGKRRRRSWYDILTDFMLERNYKLLERAAQVRSKRREQFNWNRLGIDSPLMAIIMMELLFSLAQYN